MQTSIALIEFRRLNICFTVSFSGRVAGIVAKHLLP
jgi:hypothetical protein